MIDDMSAYLMGRGDVLGLSEFGSLGMEPLNQMFHNGYPKFHSIPSS